MHALKAIFLPTEGKIQVLRGGITNEYHRFRINKIYEYIMINRNSHHQRLFFDSIVLSASDHFLIMSYCCRHCPLQIRPWRQKEWTSWGDCWNFLHQKRQKIYPQRDFRWVSLGCQCQIHLSVWKTNFLLRLKSLRSSRGVLWVDQIRSHKCKQCCSFSLIKDYNNLQIYSLYSLNLNFKLQFVFLSINILKVTLHYNNINIKMSSISEN